MDKLIEILTWGGGHSELCQLTHRHRGRVKKSFENFLQAWKSAGAHHETELLSTIDEMREINLRYHLLSTEHKIDSNREYESQSISEYERLLLAPRIYGGLLTHLKSKRAWGPSALALVEVLKLNSARISVEPIYRPPFDLVFDGPEAEFENERDGIVDLHSITEQIDLKCKTLSSMAFIKRNEPLAFNLIASVTQMMVFRKPKTYCYFATSSQNNAVGRITFANSQNPNVDLVDLTSGLIHEAIHSFLYMAESEFSFFAMRLSHKPKLKSPWTGNPICLHSFVHACFVWFALDHFWRRITLPIQKEERHRMRLLKDIRRGFSSPKFRELIKTHESYFSTELTQNILLMENLISTTRKEAHCVS